MGRELAGTAGKSERTLQGQEAGLKVETIKFLGLEFSYFPFQDVGEDCSTLKTQARPLLGLWSPLITDKGPKFPLIQFYILGKGIEGKRGGGKVRKKEKAENQSTKVNTPRS